MNVIFSIHKDFTEKIFNKEKIFEFRNTIPQSTPLGGKIFFYETSKNGGSKKVVGEATIRDIIDLRPNGQTPMYGCWNFIDYYVEHIEKDLISAKCFTEMKQYNPENYKFGSLITFALSPKYTKTIKQGEYPHYDCSAKEDNKKVDLANLYMNKCDDWLRNMGYYNDDDRSFWRYAIELDDIKKYSTPFEITDFYKKNGERIQKAPQGWMYTLN